MIELIIYLLICALVVWLAFWIIDMLPFDSTPKLIAKAIVGLVFLLVLVRVLLSMPGRPLLW